MIRLTVQRGDGTYLSAYSKAEIVKHLGIIEDALEKTGNYDENRIRWERFCQYVLDSDKVE